jgi:NAD(P)-dependent dehydrogenase (short-subunit alcohol dehydrogenase family)
MALEWAEHGIRVNAVAPGIVDAGMGAPLNADPSARQRRDARVPLGRQGRAEEIAAAVRFLGADAASYVSGHTLVVDGALTRATMAAAVAEESEEKGRWLN